MAGAPCYSALTRMDLAGKITGDLSQSFEVSADGKALLLTARWWLADPDGKTPALVRQFEQRLPFPHRRDDAETVGEVPIWPPA